jgi:hypothetical protein
MELQNHICSYLPAHPIHKLFKIAFLWHDNIIYKMFDENKHYRNCIGSYNKLIKEVPSEKKYAFNYIYN